MNPNQDLDIDEVLGFEDENGSLRVLLKDGTSLRFEGAEAERIRAMLEHATPPTI